MEWECEADGGRGYSTLHCTGVMRSRERGKEESGGGEGEDEKQDKAARLSREASRHTSGRSARMVCGLWCAGGRRVWVEMGLLGLGLAALLCWATGLGLGYDAIHGWTR
jgi:hypothetical protein